MSGKNKSAIKNIPNDAVFIIGAGHFGNRAAHLLHQQGRKDVYIVDLDEKALLKLDNIPFKSILYNGVQFLADNFQDLNPSNIIVPALPVHLAYEWLKLYWHGMYDLEQINVPEPIRTQVPLTWDGSEGSLLISYADFMCPDNCPEPDICTVSGERRSEPLYALLSNLELSGFKVHIIRSQQLAPGLGGYQVAELEKAARKVLQDKNITWLLGTACKCHGILSGFKIL